MGEQTDNPNLEKMYLAALNGPPLESDDLAYIIDCPEKEWFEFKNFEPKRTVKLLIARVSSDCLTTPPEKFYKEMNELITLKEKSSAGKFKEDDSRLKDLAKKYNIVFDSCSPKPNVITYERVTFTLPQYFIPLQKPHFSEDVEIPSLFQYPQFGGLIPSRNSKELALDEKKSILKLHIFCLFCRRPFLPNRTIVVLVRKRIESGVLSDDRRFRFLQNFNVITLNGKLTEVTKKALELALSFGPREDGNAFKDLVDEIPWSLLLE